MNKEFYYKNYLSMIAKNFFPYDIQEIINPRFEIFDSSSPTPILL